MFSKTQSKLTADKFGFELLEGQVISSVQIADERLLESIVTIDDYPSEGGYVYPSYVGATCYIHLHCGDVIKVESSVNWHGRNYTSSTGERVIDAIFKNDILPQDIKFILWNEFSSKDEDELTIYKWTMKSTSMFSKLMYRERKTVEIACAVE